MSKIITGDVRDVLPTLESESVQMCVTSPPYWGLRDYGTATWEGGDADCMHRIPATGSTQNKGNNGKIGSPFIGDCGICGARRIDAQLGLEPTPDEYVANMVAVFRDVRRVLRDDGTCWVNMGDSYACAGLGGPQRDCSGGFSGKDQGTRGRQGYSAASGANINKRVPNNIKPKDLVGMPWRLAFALQADGWYLRQDIIWHKPNPMPESVTDRCTKAHEYIFLLSKSARYYFDADAIKEDGSGKRSGNTKHKYVGVDDPVHRTKQGLLAEHWIIREKVNKRSVWTVQSQPYADAHFATFPEKLIEPCILAGSRPGDVVLDPFFGSGTTGQVCERLGREWLGVELNQEYAGMARRRTSQRGLVF